MSKQNIIIAVLILLLVGLFFYSDYKSNKLENEKRELRNQLVAKDNIIKEKDSSYSKLSYEYSSQKEMYDMLNKENSKLAKELKKKNEIITYLLSVQVKPDTVFIKDTLTYIKDSVAYFSGYTKPYTVKGEVHLRDSVTKNLKVMMDEFKLLIIGSKIENGFYKARVKFTDLNNNALEMFKVLDIESAINTDINNTAPPFLNIGVGGEIGLNELRVGVLLDLYGKNIITANYRINDYAQPLNNSMSYKWCVGYYRKLW